MKALEVLYLRVTARPGTHISEAIREAALLALTEKRQVEFEFNDRQYRASCSELLDFIERSSYPTSAVDSPDQP